MDKTEIVTTLLLGTFAAIVDMNDWAVNTVRDYCRDQGYNPVTLIAEETARIDECLNFDTYLRVSRAGSYMRLSRKIRKAVYAAVESRRICDAS